MAEAAKRSSANTDLYIGTMRAEIGLFPTAARPGKQAEFDTAGPNGGVLRVQQQAVAAPVGEEAGDHVPVKADPLADPGSDVPPLTDTVERAEEITESGRRLMDSTVPGEFRQVLVEEATGVAVEPGEVRKGVRLEDGSFVDCTEQLTAITERTKLDRIDVVACIDSTQIRRERVIGSYFVGAQASDARPVLRLLYEALRERREVAVVKYTLKTRQQLGVVIPHAKTGTLVLLQLVYAEDWREAPTKATGIQSAEVTEQQVERMAGLLELLHRPPDVLDELRDDAISLREELRARAQSGEMSAEVVEPLPQPEDMDMGEALERSIQAVREGRLSAGKV